MHAKSVNLLESLENLKARLKQLRGELSPLMDEEAALAAVIEARESRSVEQPTNQPTAVSAKPKILRVPDVSGRIVSDAVIEILKDAARRGVYEMTLGDVYDALMKSDAEVRLGGGLFRKRPLPWRVLLNALTHKKNRKVLYLSKKPGVKATREDVVKLIKRPSP